MFFYYFTFQYCHQNWGSSTNIIIIYMHLCEISSSLGRRRIGDNTDKTLPPTTRWHGQKEAVHYTEVTDTWLGIHLHLPVPWSALVTHQTYRVFEGKANDITHVWNNYTAHKLDWFYTEDHSDINPLSDVAWLS